MDDMYPFLVNISNLSPLVTDDQVMELSHSSRLRRFSPKRSFLPIPQVDADPVPQLRNALYGIERVQAVNIERYRQRDLELDGTATCRIRFSSPEVARQARDHLAQRILFTLSIQPLDLQLPEPGAYHLTISLEQATAQKKLWKDLVDGISDRKSCDCSVERQEDMVRISVTGQLQSAVGAMKVRVEAIALGERMEGWHHTFADPSSPTFRRIMNRTGAWITADAKNHVICLFGEDKAIRQAKGIIEAELQRLAEQEYTVTLARGCLGFFMRQGVQTLRELLGEERVTLEAWSRRITVSGGEEARHHLSRLIAESLEMQRRDTETGQQCPICFDDVTSPFRLDCGHTYCGPCIRNCLKSAIDGGQFPLLCIGDDMRCSEPIALPTLERFLPLTSFNQLQEAAVKTHIQQNAAEFKYCATPGCKQIYQVTSEKDAQALQCPSCFAGVCSACGGEPHMSTVCQSARDRQWTVHDEWMRQEGIKKCPSCSLSFLYQRHTVADW
jgi:hypothetical protein